MLRTIGIFVAGVVVGLAAGGGYGYTMLQNAGSELQKIAQDRDLANKAKEALSSARDKAEAAVKAAEQKVQEYTAVRAELEATKKAKADLEAKLAEVQKAAAQPAPVTGSAAVEAAPKP